MLLNDGESSPGEGKASCNFFHIKRDICFGMTQAGSHHPHRRGEEGQHPHWLGQTCWAWSFHPGSARKRLRGYNKPKSSIS